MAKVNPKDEGGQVEELKAEQPTENEQDAAASVAEDVSATEITEPVRVAPAPDESPIPMEVWENTSDKPVRFRLKGIIEIPVGAKVRLPAGYHNAICRRTGGEVSSVSSVSPVLRCLGPEK